MLRDGKRTLIGGESSGTGPLRSADLSLAPSFDEREGRPTALRGLDRFEYRGRAIRFRR
jgi:hypothetical protein